MALHQYVVEPEHQAEMSAWLDGPHPSPVTPRGASTVLLLREGAGGVEVFLLRRRSSMAFAPRMHAFPGGGVDPRDSDVDLPWVGPSPAEWGAALNCPTSLAGALVCAAVRELFEECGVLLAGADADAVVGDVSGPDWEADRLALLDRSCPMSELLIRRGLHLRSDLLRPWAHWTTPEFEPRRFDTWFFVAALPVGQHARDVGGEADHTRWIGIDELLVGERQGRLPMYPRPLRRSRMSLRQCAIGPSRPGGRRGGVGTDRSGPPRHAVAGSHPAGVAVMQVDLDGRGGGRPGPEALTWRELPAMSPHEAVAGRGGRRVPSACWRPTRAR